jgi:hypothetical protein
MFHKITKIPCKENHHVPNGISEENIQRRDNIKGQKVGMEGKESLKREGVASKK